MLSNLLKSITKSKIVPYFFIGIGAACIDVGFFIFMYEMIGLSALISHSISVPLSAIFSFLSNAYLNFKTTDFLFFRFLSFVTVIFVGYLLGAAIIIFTDDFLEIGGRIGKLTSLPFVFLLQFYLNSKISFRN